MTPEATAGAREYKIIFAGDSDSLTEDVNAHIRLGWEPLGGVAVTSVFSDYGPGGRVQRKLYQSMIKQEQAQ